MAKREEIQLVLDVDQKKAKAAMGEIQKEISDIKTGFQGLTAGTKEYEQQIKKLETATQRWAENASIADLQKEFNKLNREVKQLVPGTQAYIEKSKQLAVVRDRFKQVNAELRGITEQQQKATGFFGKMLNSVKGFGAEIVTGLSIAAVVQFAQAVAQTILQFKTLRGETQQLTGETGGALTELTAKVKAVADTFGKDYKEVLIASNVVAKQFGIAQAEAITLIQKGFLAGADNSGEFLNILKEYPAQFQQVGLSAEESIAIITQSIKDGVFSDKGADAIKEAGLRLGEFTKPAQDAIDAIGLSSKKIGEELRNGTKTTGQVIKEISAQIKTLPEGSQAAATAIANIFGGAGEDAGRKFIETISTAKTGINGLIDTSNQLVEAQIKQLAAQERLSKAWATIAALTPSITGVTTNIKAFFTEVLAGLFILIDEAPLRFQIFVARIKEMINKAIKAVNSFTAPIAKLIGQDFSIGLLQVEESANMLAWELQLRQLERNRIADQQRQQNVEKAAKNAAAIGKVQTDAAKQTAKAIETIQKGSIADLKRQIADLQKKIEESNDLELKIKLLADLSSLQNQLTTAETQLTDARNAMSGLSIPAAIKSIPQEQLDAVVGQIETSETQIADMQKRFEQQRRDDLQQSTTFYLTKAQERKQAELDAINATRQGLSGLSAGFSTLADALGESSEAAKVMRTISLALAAAEQIAAVAAGIKAISLAAGQPFPANIVAIGTTIGALGGAIASITALIKSANAQPKYAKGGTLPTAGKGGIPHGASHAQGGIALVSATGAKIGEIEGGEPILSLATYRNNKEIIDRLLYASMFGNGKKIFASGGFLPGQSIAAPVVPAASGIADGLFANAQNALIAQNQQIIQLLSGIPQQKLVAVLSPKTFQEVQDLQTNFKNRSRI